MKNKLSFLLLFIYFVISSSCKHELETPSWDVDIITPIVSTQVTIDQINIEDSLLEIQSNDSGLVSLVFENNLSSSLTNLIPFPWAHETYITLFLISVLSLSYMSFMKL